MTAAAAVVGVVVAVVAAATVAGAAILVLQLLLFCLQEAKLVLNMGVWLLPLLQLRFMLWLLLLLSSRGCSCC